MIIRSSESIFTTMCITDQKTSFKIDMTMSRTLVIRILKSLFSIHTPAPPFHAFPLPPPLLLCNPPSSFLYFTASLIAVNSSLYYSASPIAVNPHPLLAVISAINLNNFTQSLQPQHHLTLVILEMKFTNSTQSLQPYDHLNLVILEIKLTNFTQSLQPYDHLTLSHSLRD